MAGEKVYHSDRFQEWSIPGLPRTSLQARGFATAVRVLLADADGPAPALTRQEAVALVVTLERLSASLAFVRELL